MTSAVHFTDEHAQRFLEGLLPDPIRSAGEAHLAECLECTALVEEHRALMGAFDALTDPLPPIGFTQAVLARVEKKERLARRERLFAVGILAGAVAAAVIAFSLAGQTAWVDRLTQWTSGFAAVARFFSIAGDVIPAVASALRLHVVAAALLLGIPVVYSLRRTLAPARSTV